MPRPQPAPGTIARLLRVRDELGLGDRVRLDHRCFLLEDVNAVPIPKRCLDGEIPVVGAEFTSLFRWHQPTGNTF